MANKNVPAKGTQQKKEFFLIRWIKNLGRYIAESYKELKKVAWPTKKELIKSTWVVLVIVLLFAVLTYLFDTVFSFLTNLVYNLV